MAKSLGDDAFIPMAKALAPADGYNVESADDSEGGPEGC